MFGIKKAGMDIANAIGMQKASINRQTNIISRKMDEQTQEISRHSNAAEVANDLELIKQGFLPHTMTIPSGVPIIGLWKQNSYLGHETQTHHVEWSYTMMSVIWDRIEYDEVGTISRNHSINESHDNELEKIKHREMFLKHYAEPKTFHAEYCQRPDLNYGTSYILKGVVEGYWHDVENKLFYRKDRPNWWKLA